MENYNTEFAESQQIVNDLNKKIADEDKKKSENANNVIVCLAKARCSFFHNKNNETFAEIKHETGNEYLAIYSPEFESFLYYLYFKSTRSSPTERNLKSAMRTLDGIARFDNDETREVFIRTAKKDGKYYIDLCNDKFQVVELSKDGRRVLDESPVCFLRSKYQRALPVPVPPGEGSLDGLFDLINIKEELRGLWIVWCIEALRPETPYPILQFIGGKGSGKSRAAYFTRQLIDPHEGDLDGPPDSIMDNIYIPAASNLILTFNNCSEFKNNVQNALCCVSDGGVLRVRQFYYNLRMIVCDIRRPAIVTGINPCITNLDCNDRTITFEFDKPSRKLKFAEMQEIFDANHANWFGALLDVWVKAEQEEQDFEINETYLRDAVKRDGESRGLSHEHIEVPRFLDTAYLGERIYSSYYNKTNYDFCQDWEILRKRATAKSVCLDPVLTAIRDYAYWKKYKVSPYNPLHDKNGNEYIQFGGRISDIYAELKYAAKNPDNLPKSNRKLSETLNDISEAARIFDIYIEKDKTAMKRGNGYYYVIKIYMKNIRR